MDRWYSKNLLAKLSSYFLLLTLLIGAVTYAYTWKRLATDPLNTSTTGYDLLIVPGTSINQFTTQLKKEKLFSQRFLMRLYLIYKGNTKHIQAGEYRIVPGMTALQLLDKVFAGDVTQYSFTVIEGWQSNQVITALQQHPKLKATLTGMSDQEIIRKLDIPAQHLEGLFLPDTYFFTAFTTDVEFLRRAYFSMQNKLQQAWQQRDANCAVADPYQALILASIIEKETGLKKEYAEISGVFSRRLAKKMKLQADPTVIYALQNNLSGPLLRKHLSINSPYNTYKYAGLPPTPIALPSIAAIEAALHPAPGDSLYFVANGDGGHVFSNTLPDHNKSVQHLYNRK